MISTVRARRNHYEVLGLKPGASDEEIAQAFAREIKTPRPSAFGGLVEVSVAYETLRDPVRRRAHDVALGLIPKPPRPHLYAATARWAGTPFSGAVLARPVHDKLPTPAPAETAAPAKSELPAEPKATPFIAASLPVPAGVQPEPPRAPEPEAKLEPQIPAPSRHAEEPRARELPARELNWGEAEHRTIEWKRPAIIIGVPVAAMVLIGTVLGWQAGKGEEQPQVTTALPPAKPRPATATASQATTPAYELAEAQPRRMPRRIATARIEPSPAAPTPTLSDDPLAAQPEPGDVADSAAEPAAVADAPAVDTSAAMPLPKAVIARTIHRIGYACGQVASTSAVEGARGVYNVTCTSGASYQAKPVRGRYHFRRVR